MLTVVGFGLAERSRRAWARPLAPAAAGQTGGAPVAVAGLYRAHLLGSSRNNVTARLEVTPDSLCFSIVGVDRWRFDEIVLVDAPSGAFGTRVLFKKSRWDCLAIDLGDRAAAGGLLRALPRSLPLTPQAVGLRDQGSPPAA